ncbi:MAG: hypothetical protein ACUVV3_02895 [Dehalococcoidia bacterium]
MVAAVAVVVGLTLAFALCDGDDGPAVDGDGVLPYAAVGGSVSVALADGQTPKTGMFEEKCDAYLVAREQDSPLRLPDSDYFFQVTDTSGKTLLSGDEVKFRQFRVADGVIEGVSGQGRHGVGSDGVRSGATIQLCPFAESLDGSGVYQVWVTRVEDFQEDAEGMDSTAGNSHGFLVTRSARALFGVSPAR